MSTATPTLDKVTDTVKKGEICPPKKVLLHNDEVHSMDEVVVALVETFPDVTAERAVDIMYEAHTHDVGLVGTYPEEYAEMYVDLMKGRGLKCTIEGV